MFIFLISLIITNKKKIFMTMEKKNKSKQIIKRKE